MSDPYSLQGERLELSLLSFKTLLNFISINTVLDFPLPIQNLFFHISDAQLIMSLSRFKQIKSSQSLQDINS